MHKLAMEAFCRLMWNTFVEWYAGHTGDDEEHAVNKDAVMRRVEECRCPITAKAELRASMKELHQEAQDLCSLFQYLKAKSRAKSKMFAFWEECGDKIKLPLQFIKAERIGNREFPKRGNFQRDANIFHKVPARI